jgi:hypothetical protein
LCKRIAAGDGGTKAELESAVLKYVATQYVDTTQALKNLYRDETELGHLVRKAVEVIADHGDGGASNDGGSANDHALSRLAELLTETGRYPHRAAALDYLMHDPRGHVLARTHKGDTMTSPTEPLERIVKSHGVAGLLEVAQNITDSEKSYSLTEEEFVRLIDMAARVARPDLGALAFGKVYEQNPVLARAIAVLKGPTWERDRPYLSFRTVTGEDFQPNVISGQDAYDAVIDPEAALAELHELGHKLYPKLPANLAFARVFEDPKFAELAQRAHRRPSPTTFYAMPARTGTEKREKRDGSTGGAYSELLAKAKELQAVNPGMTEAQAFEKVYVDPSNIALAARERSESRV